MTMDEAIKLGDEAMSRDPRTAPYGYFSGSSFVLATAQAFMWFPSIIEMVDHMAQCDPIIHDLDEKEAEEFAAVVRTIFEHNPELTDENLEKLNEASKEFLRIDWWGTFDDLTHGNSELARELRSSIREDESEDRITSAEMDDFVELVHSYGF